MIEDTTPVGEDKPKPEPVRVRNEKGHFLKGNPIRPRNPGRPHKANIQHVLDAITQELTIEEIREKLRWCMVESEKQGDIKMMLETLRFVANYAIGKPVQRSIQTNVDLNQFRRLFSKDGEDVTDEDEEIIDVTQTRPALDTDAPDAS